MLFRDTPVVGPQYHLLHCPVETHPCLTVSLHLGQHSRRWQLLACESMARISSQLPHVGVIESMAAQIRIVQPRAQSDLYVDIDSCLRADSSIDASVLARF